MINKRIEQYLVESMPVGKIERYGNFTGPNVYDGLLIETYKPQDLRLINSDKYFERVRANFRCAYYFDIYFINTPNNRLFSNQGKGQGKVTLPYIKSNLDKDFYNMLRTNYNASHITIIIAGNDTVSKVGLPLTPWILAHRISHAFEDNKQSDIYNTNIVAFERTIYYNIAAIRDLWLANVTNFNIPSYNEKDFFQSRLLFTFKSARYDKIAFITELKNELIAQFISNGKVRLNNANYILDNSPESIITNLNMNERLLAKIDKQITTMEMVCNRDIDRLLKKAVGDIFAI